MATQKRVLPQWLQNAIDDPDSDHDPGLFLCVDLAEAAEVSRLLGIEATMTAGPEFEAPLRAVCADKGVPFSPQMKAACDRHARAQANRPPTLEEMCAPYGGLDVFLATYCPLPDEE